jgi:hypothetical protein
MHESRGHVKNPPVLTSTDAVPPGPNSNRARPTTT